MQKKLARIAPIGIVALTMGYFCWSHVGDPSGPPVLKAAPKTDMLTAVQLSPPPAPTLDRDPFERHAPVVVATPDGPKPKDEADSAAAVEVAKNEPSPLQQAFDAGEFVLNGSYVHGNARLAVINGKIYSQGQELTVGEPPTVLGLVKHIGIDRVELASGNTSTALTYAPLERATAADTKGARTIAKNGPSKALASATKSKPAAPRGSAASAVAGRLPRNKSTNSE